MKLNEITFELQNNKVDDAAYIVVADTKIIIPLKGVVNTSKEIQKLISKKKD